MTSLATSAFEGQELGDIIDQYVMISQLTSHEEHSDLVLIWLRSTWDDPNNVFANTLSPTRNCPGALLAISDGVPLGALTFRRHRTQHQATAELWINAVYVVPSHRRRGIGRQLIRSATEHSIPQYAERLYVFTDVPTLYESLGWKRINYRAEHSSFTLSFAPSSIASTEFSELDDAHEPPT